MHAATIPLKSAPCQCWHSPVVSHSGHCCFKHFDPDKNVVTCGHDEKGMEIF